MDKIEKIKAEVERCYNNNIYGHTAYSNGKCSAFREVLAFINSLPEEPVSEELMNAANDYGLNVRKGYPRVMDETDRYIYNAFQAGAKWQKQQTIDKAEEWLRYRYFIQGYLNINDVDSLIKALEEDKV